MKRNALGLLILCWLFGLSACAPKSANSPLPEPVFHSEGNPKSLSEWGMLGIDQGKLVIANQSFSYDLNTPLFTDYAHKLRTIHIPTEKTASISNDGDSLAFPIGTIITKTFYYPKGETSGSVIMTTSSFEGSDNSLQLDEVRLIETRILARRQDGWIALPYVWNAEQTQAVLKRTGDVIPMTLGSNDFAYIVPNTNQCAGCHATNNTTREIVPIGPKIRHLRSLKKFEITAPLQANLNVDWKDKNQSLESRARAYLDINCSHCHNEVGPADTSGLHLTPETPIGPHFGLCKLPIAAGTGTGNRKFGIVPGEAEQSIFVYRMNSENPAVMMPELGRSLAHAEGVELITNWIDSLEGDCSAG